MSRRSSISVSGRLYAKLRVEAEHRGVTMAALLEQAISYPASARAEPRPAVRTRPSITLLVDSPQTRWARRRREANAAAGLCLNENNAGTHGKATHGKLCKACRDTHRGTPVVPQAPIAVLIDRVFATMPVVRAGSGDEAQRAGAARRMSALRHEALERDHGITVDTMTGLYVRKARIA